jgi:hypothetical protein
LFSNSNSVVNSELLVMGLQRLEDNFSIVRTNLRPWFYVFGLNTNDGSVEWRVGACFYIGKSLVWI